MNKDMNKDKKKDINIIDYLCTDRFKTKEELAKETGLSDRAIRNKVSELKLKVPVLFNSRTKGYKLPGDLEKMSKTEILEELALINHSIGEIESRKRVFNMQERAYIAYKVVAERLAYEEKGEDQNGDITININ